MEEGNNDGFMLNGFKILYPLCNAHKRKSRHYCETCKEYICDICMRDHKKHSIDSIKLIVEEEV